MRNQKRWYGFIWWTSSRYLISLSALALTTACASTNERIANAVQQYDFAYNKYMKQCKMIQPQQRNYCQTFYDVMRDYQNVLKMIDENLKLEGNLKYQLQLLDQVQERLKPFLENNDDLNSPDLRPLSESRGSGIIRASFRRKRNNYGSNPFRYPKRTRKTTQPSAADNSNGSIEYSAGTAGST